MSILSVFVIIPALMLLGLWLAKNLNQVRGVMVAGSSCLLALSIWLTIYFIQERAAGNTAEMLLTYSTPWFKPLNIAYSVGVDGISVVMLLLSSIIVFTGTFASWQLKPLTKEYFLWFTLLSTGVFGFFISTDLFTMFMFYEVALIPMYLLIGVWGSGRKEYSAMKLTLMLMGGSALLILGLLGIYYFNGIYSGSYTFELTTIAANHCIPGDIQNIFFPFIFIGFGVLGALFPFHTWSPDGHASAPTAVSMLHAGVLMKLGGYGCFRVAMYLLPEAAQDLSWIFLILTTISVVYGALSACVQTDLKYINAYSSVSHCGLVLFALLMMSQTAVTGAVLQMLSHGLMTALFFALIGMIYGRTHTRDIRELFIAEMTIFVGSFGAHPMSGDPNTSFRMVATIIACTSIVVTAVYILRVVGKILYGEVENKHFLELTDATWDERVAVICLIFCVAGLGSFPFWVSDIISPAAGTILESIGVM